MSTDEDEKRYDAGNEADVAKAKKKNNNEISQEIGDLRAMMSTKQGRRHMWRLLGRCGIYHESFHLEALIMARNEGRRYIGLQYLSLMTENCLDLYQLMENENRNP